MTRHMTRHWVLLETGGNQRYVFASNRSRHMVGGSQLVLESCTDWVSEAVQELRAAGRPAPEPVQLVSGKALLLAPDRDSAQALIRAVTTRALREAPDLELTGAIGPAFDESLTYRPPVSQDEDGRLRELQARRPLDHVTALMQTFTLQQHARADRPPSQLRAPILPWHQLCRETGRPAAGLELYGADPRSEQDWFPASAAVAARSAARPRAGDRLRALAGSADIVPGTLDDLGHDGWIAVIHADGNGVGALFQRFPDLICAAEDRADLDLDTHRHYLQAVAAQLEQATTQALSEAVSQALDGWRGSRNGILLPIVVGGDDVTLACHARLALPLVRAFLTGFEQHTRDCPELSRLAAALQADGSSWLSAAAGIAFVKPHHPFDLAYDLAEELVQSAKISKDAVRRPVSTFDLHVAHESTLRALPDLRAAVTLTDGDTRMLRHAGPYVVNDPEDADLAGLPASERAWLRTRHVAHLDRLVARLAGGPDQTGGLSSSRAHELRSALDRGPQEYRATRELVLARAGAGDDLRELLREQPVTRPVPGATGRADETFIRLMDAMVLHGAGLHGAGPHGPGLHGPGLHAPGPGELRPESPTETDDTQVGK